MFPNKDFHITPIFAIEHDISEDCLYIIISTEEKYNALTQKDNMLVVRFADTEDKNRYDAISECDVKAIVNFLESTKAKSVFVACSEGVSRSAAAAAGLIRSSGGDDSYIWKSDEYRPNVLVYKTILEYFYPHGTVSKELSNLAGRSPEEYRYFRKHDKDLEFDKIVCHQVGITQIDYGFIYGVKKHVVLFVKVGRDGTIFGYRKKYLNLASHIAEKYGITVIVSSNPFCSYKWVEPLEDAAGILEEYFGDHNIAESKRKALYYGHSDGASMAALYGNDFSIFDAFLLSNLPLPTIRSEEDADEACNEAIKILLRMTTININKQVILVYGENDSAYETWNRVFADVLLNHGQLFEVHVIKNEGHNISEPVVMILPELFFDENALIDKGLESDPEEVFL